MKVTCPLMSALPTLSDLSLAHHAHDFVSLQCSTCRLEGKETHPWLDQPLDEAMILFDDVVEILDLPQFRAFRQDRTRFEVSHRFGIGCMLIHVDHTKDRRDGVAVSRSHRRDYLLLDWTSLRS